MKTLWPRCVQGLALVMVAMVAIANESKTLEMHHHSAAASEQKPFGIAGDKRDVGRTVRLRMIDEMRFVPDKIEVREGETVRFVLTNNGKLLHELVLGTRKDLEAHASMMRRGESMQHDQSYIAHVAPGQTGEIVWKFNQAGRFDFACLVPGHFEAGMTGTVIVQR